MPTLSTMCSAAGSHLRCPQCAVLHGADGDWDLAFAKTPSEDSCVPGSGQDWSQQRTTDSPCAPYCIKVAQRVP